jgi:hypothetical protein
MDPQDHIASEDSTPVPTQVGGKYLLKYVMCCTANSLGQVGRYSDGRVRIFDFGGGRR